MLNLKSAYFYFLATKINLIKLLKKLYFTTNFYRSSLISNIPTQFYFHLNPFLLSSFTNYKDFTFKVSEVDPNNFWAEKDLKKDTKNLHNFLWLNLITRKHDSFLIQTIIAIWIEKNSKYQNIVWNNSILSRRIISWILNAEIIINSADNNFKKKFFRSIIMQVNHLRKNVGFEGNSSKKIEVICAILLSGLVFKDYSENFEQATKDLEKLIEIFFDEDGFPINRNPDTLVHFSKYLILIKECIKDSHQYLPDYIDNAIDKILISLKSIITKKYTIPLFNGATLLNHQEYFQYIERLNYKLKKTNLRVGGLQVIRYKKNLIYFDVGQPPKKNYSSEYQSGPLSFEYYYDDEKIITNCGFGSNISKKAALLSRLTSAQSTLSLNDTSVVRFERNKLINNAFGNSIKNNFKTFDVSFFDEERSIISTASHNAYEKDFGFYHKRTIEINKLDYLIKGTDEIVRVGKDKRVKFNIRFHLFPGIGAIKTIGGNSILIQFKKNKSLIFSSSNQNLSIDKSIFLGGNKILNNLCINIYGDIITGSKKIMWEIKKV
ncbi:MAG: putative conserved protein, heparinase superfamily [Pelagibacterales bacterium]|jgi:uncharacterized heparinase superfamily protein|nr:putative conserved protein, heparinase superfamily [Pelagibacterales bacterium]|tara:strand:- start:582 stop:2225 length:1644 start_codon:yes stop_codon:yes gene_type:complete